MDANQVTPQESQAQGSRAPGVSVSRRRFTRAGLSASVVLGSMASQPVLGAAPYHCTVSGKLSGNISPRPGATVDCKTIGKSLSYWRSATDWTEAPGFVKGTVPLSADACAVPSGSTTTLFNGTLGLISAFYSVDSSGTCVASVTPSVTPTAATMYQVLLTTDTSEPVRLGRAVVVSLLNVASLGANNYPVDNPTIVTMFNATFGGGLYQVNSTVQWTRAQVIEYLEGLYPSI